MSSSASRTRSSRSLKKAHLLREGMNPSPTRSRAAIFVGAGLIPARSHRAPCIRTFLSNLPLFREVCVAVAVSALVILIAGPARAAEVWLDVSKAADRKIVLALPPLAANEGPDDLALRQTLENDLVVTGFFRLLPLAGPPLAQAEKERGTTQPDHAAWAAFGAELLLRVSVARQDGRLVLRATLFDVGARTQLLSREESDAPAEAPRLAHRLSDAVVRALTGGPGLALTRIAATWSNGTDPKRVVIMDYDGRNQRSLSADGVLALHPAWFPDGTRVAYVTYRQGRPEIVAQNVTTGQVRSLAFFPGLNASPAISPDGRLMLLVLSRDGNPEVYRMAVDGSELKRLTFTPAVETSPVWSPDGAQIALVSDQGGGPQIHLLGANGGRMRRVSFMGNYATSPDWSPRGDRIIFTAQIEGTFQLVLLDPATGDQQQLTFDAEHKENPAFAPNGRHVVYSQGRGSAYRLVIIDTLTGERSRVSREKGSFTSPAWSP
jgi:TolB protein